MGDLLASIRVMRARASGNMPTALLPGQIFIDEYLGKFVFPDASSTPNAQGQYTAFVSIDLKGLVAALTAVRSVATGGTGASVAGGAALDNISGFSGTGLLTRTGAATYSFTSTATFTTPAQAAAAAPVQSVAGLTGSPSATQVKAALSIAIGDVSGLGGAATLNVGTAASTVAAGNDSRITGALQASANAVAADIWAGTSTAKFVTPKVIYDASAFVALTDAASIAVDLSTLINATVTLAGNRTLANPTNAKVGQSGVIRVLQDATGSRTLAFGTAYDFGAAGVPTLQTGANKEDLISYFVVDATTPRLRCTFSKGA